MDTVDKATRSRIMSAIRGKNTMPERLMAAALKKHGLKFKQWAELPGKPDFYFPDHSLVVDVFGDFWHACPKHYGAPKSNSKFWRDKVTGNRKRDRRVIRSLQAMGFTVIRFWECEVRKDPDKCARKVFDATIVLRGKRYGNE